MKKKNFLGGYRTYDTSQGFGTPSDWGEAFRQRMTPEEAETLLQGHAKPPHEILGVSTTASISEIKKAYRQLIRKWHPDVNLSNLEEAEIRSKELNAAYTILVK